MALGRGRGWCEGVSRRGRMAIGADSAWGRVERRRGAWGSWRLPAGLGEGNMPFGPPHVPRESPSVRGEGVGAVMGNQPGLSDSEREVLKVLWDRGPGNVREIKEVLAGRGRRWAYTTVATLLQRLAAKQYVASDPTTVPHVYRASVSRD